MAVLNRTHSSGSVKVSLRCTDGKVHHMTLNITEEALMEYRQGFLLPRELGLNEEEYSFLIERQAPTTTNK